MCPIYDHDFNNLQGKWNIKMTTFKLTQQCSSKALWMEDIPEERSRRKQHLQLVPPTYWRAPAIEMNVKFPSAKCAGFSAPWGGSSESRGAELWASVRTSRSLSCKTSVCTSPVRWIWRSHGQTSSATKRQRLMRWCADRNGPRAAVWQRFPFDGRKNKNRRTNRGKTISKVTHRLKSS